MDRGRNSNDSTTTVRPSHDPPATTSTGHPIETFRKTINDHFFLFRSSCVTGILLGTLLLLRSAAKKSHVSRLSDIPPQWFQHQRNIRVCVSKVQNQQDHQMTTTLCVMHQPRVLTWIPRWFRPTTTSMPVRLLGLDLSPAPTRAWVAANVISSQPFLTLELIHHSKNDDEIIIGRLYARRNFRRRLDIGKYLITQGHARMSDESESLDLDTLRFRESERGYLAQLKRHQDKAQAREWGPLWKNETRPGPNRNDETRWWRFFGLK